MRFRLRTRKQLDAINSGPSALCYASHVGRLGQEAIILSNVDQPIRQDATALTAQSKHCNRQWTFERSGHLSVCQSAALCAPLEPADHGATQRPHQTVKTIGIEYHLCFVE